MAEQEILSIYATTMTLTAPDVDLFPPVVSSRLDDIVEAVRTLIAASATFQLATGSATAAAALSRVYHSVVPAGSLTPLCLVPDPLDIRWEIVGTGCVLPFGEIVVQFVEAVGTGRINDSGDVADWDEVAKRLRQVCGAIMDEIVVLGRTPGYMMVRGLSLDGPAWFEAKKRRRLHKKENVPAACGQNMSIRFGAER